MRTFPAASNVPVAAHRVTGTLFDRDMRLPTEPLDLGGIEMHEWRIAEPAELASVVRF